MLVNWKEQAILERALLQAMSREIGHSLALQLIYISIK